MHVRIPTREEIHAAFEQGEEAVGELFGGVCRQVEQLAEQLEKQAGILKDLQARANKNSRNSGKPPSSDGYGKPPAQPRTESLRESGRRPNGGQPGHEGHTLKRSENPDRTEIHEAGRCTHCGLSLQEVEASGQEERQVYDIPAIRIEVTAHRVEVKTCPHCGTENRGEFPAGVTRAVQYGEGVKTWAAYFPSQHFVSVERTAQILEDLSGHRISEAAVLKAGEELCGCVRPATEVVKELLRRSEVLNTDESGVRVKGKLHWLHVASNDRLTDYEVHTKRGKEAMDEAGVLPQFKGTLVHDHWKSYFGYEGCTHALCNAHHLRELKYLEKQYGQAWAKEMAALLCEGKQAADEAWKRNLTGLPAERIRELEQRYDAIVRAGFDANPRSPPEERAGQPNKRGRPKQTPPLNLLDRLRDFKPQVLAFLHDFRVPFDNNQAERDVRMVKVKQKVSGSFRTVEGAEHFTRIRGYISTARKNAVDVFDAIRGAFGGKPFIPSSETR